MSSEVPSFFNPEQCHNEAEVESKFIVHYLLPVLGYSPQTWRQEVTFGSIRLDFLAVTTSLFGPRSQLRLILEAKHPKHNLDQHVRRFRRYLSSLDVCYGVLTNGRWFRIYEQTNGDLHLLLQLPGHEVPNHLDQIRQLISRDVLQARSPLQEPVQPPQPLESQPEPVPPSSIVESEDSDRLPLRGTVQPPQPLEPQPVSTPSVSQAPSVSQIPSQAPSVSQTPSNLESSMKVIAVYHNKGGVGKTTTVINLAAALSKKGKRILVIDLDSQANTTYATGLVKFQDELSDTIKDCYVYHVILEKNNYPISEVVRQSTFTSPGFDVVPSHIDLMEHERELVEVAPALTRLVSKLQKVKDHYDIVLIDTPPSLNLYARVALIAADYLIIPSDLKPFANEGLRNVRNFVSNINEFRDEITKEPLKILGVLPSKVATSAKFVEHTLPKMEAIVGTQYGFPLLKSRIFERRDVSAAIERTLEMGDLEIPNPCSILDYKPDSQAAEEFEQLATEVLALIKD